MKILHTRTLKSLIVSALLASATLSYAQVKVGDNPTTVNAGSALEIESTNKGLLMPRIALTNTTTWGLLGTAVAGMHVFNTNMSITSTNTNYPTLVARIGEYYWDGTGWVAISPEGKALTVSTHLQTAGLQVMLPTASAAGYCAIGNLTCATFINLAGSFAVNRSDNDVILDYTGFSSVSNNTTRVSYIYVIAMDKTTPGTFEMVDNFYYEEAALNCSAATFNYKSVFKNLPVRTAPYQVRVYLSPWINPGVPGTLGLGMQSSSGGCGNSNPSRVRLVVSVNQ